MYEEIFAKNSAQLNELAAPAKKFNALVLDQAEKLIGFQFDAVQSYTDLALEQTRAALSIEDANSAKAFVEGQTKVAESVSKKIQDDASTLASLGKDFGAEVQKLAQDNVAVLSSIAQPVAAKKPASRARKTASA